MSLMAGCILQSRYRILRPLGQGGMGAVYLAEDLRLNGRMCAIKESIPDPTASPQALAQIRRQFQAEASVLANLDHPNLPKVSDYFSDSGNEYIVMDYVAGEDLASVQAHHGAALPEQSVLLWADQVLDALECLHSQHPNPIIHRDIKPANLILTAQGRIKLVDFGLVKLFDPSNPHTATVMKGMGTPEYTPLEQYGITSDHTDSRSDIYALGATLYHLVTGVAPLPSPQRLANPAALPPPRLANPAFSATTAAVIMKAMAISPDQRYQSAAEMRAALAKSRGFSRGGSPLRRWFWAIAAVVLILFAATTFSMRAARRDLPPEVPVWTSTLVVIVVPTLSRTALATAFSTSSPTLLPTVRLTATATSMPSPPPALPIASVVPPTATREPTAAPTVTSTQTAPPKPVCSIAVRGEFSALWNNNWQLLGCPTDSGSIISPACEQAFQGGHLFWRSDTTQVYMVFDKNKANGADLTAGDWFIGPREWGWDGSDPQGIGLQPPAGLYEPIGGLGWLWRKYLGGVDGRLGWAVAKEYCFERLAVAQKFQQGIAYKSSDPKAYALLTNKQFVAQR